MTHPLTDDIIDHIALNASWSGDYGNAIVINGDVVFTREDMRAAYDKGADWQLEQVIEWVKSHIDTGNLVCDWGDTFIDRLKKAMRPQEDN